MTNSKKNTEIVDKYLDSIGDFTPTYDEIHSQDLGVPEDKDLYRLTDIEGLNDSRSKYSVREKLQAVTLYSVLGNFQEVERRTGVKADTLKYWKNETEWWGEAMERIRLQRDEKLEAELTVLLHKSAAELKERLTQGDEVLMKDGSRERVKMKGRDLVDAYIKLQDKRALLRGENAGKSKTEVSTTQQIMQGLKSDFEKLSDKITRTLEEKIVSEQ